LIVDHKNQNEDKIHILALIARQGVIIVQILFTGGNSNCITVNVTMRSNVASGEMLLSDRQKSLSEEQHDEPEKQA
jgi:hypothetical protein